MILAEYNRNQQISNDRLSYFGSRQTTTRQTDDEDECVRKENDPKETTIKTEDLVTEIPEPPIVGLLRQRVLQVAFPWLSLLEFARGQLWDRGFLVESRSTIGRFSILGCRIADRGRRAGRRWTLW